MGTSCNELDHASSPSISEQETRTDGDLKVSSPTDAKELNSLTSSKNFNPSPSSLSHSPSPDSPIEHDNPPQGTNAPFEVIEDANLDTRDSKDEHETPTAESPASTSDTETPDDEMLLFTLDSGDEENPETSNVNVALSSLSPELTDSTLELGSNNPTTSPPTQVMERPSKSKYRIPSSVFARSKSGTPPDWSGASNDSLFSIQMGNMSFIKDDFWKSGELALKSAELEMIKNGDLDMLRSGELGSKSGELEMQSGELETKNGELGMGTREPETIPGEAVTRTEPSMSTQMFSYSQTPNIATNSGKTAELGVAIETMKEVIREAADHKSKNSISDGGNVHISNGRSSTESFAFSSGAEASLRVGIRAKSDTGSLHKAPSQSQTQSTSQPKTEHEPKSPAAALHTAKTGWFSWMSCYWCRPFSCL